MKAFFREVWEYAKVWSRLAFGKDVYGYRPFGVVLIGMLVVWAVGLFAIVAAVTTVDRHNAKQNCVSWGQTTGLPAKFVSSNWWSYDCYTKEDGHWLPKSSIRVVK